MSNGRWASSLGNNKQVDNSWSTSQSKNKWGSSEGSGNAQKQEYSNYGNRSSRSPQKVTISTQTHWGSQYNDYLQEERERENRALQFPDVNCCKIV